MLRAAASFNPRPKDFLGIQQMFHDVFFTRFTRLEDGEVESWDLYVTPIDCHFNSGDSLHGVLDFNPRYERLFAPLETSPGVVLVPGEYRFTRFGSVFASARKRRFSGFVNFGWVNFGSGKAEEIVVRLTFELTPWLTLALGGDQTFALRRRRQGRSSTRPRRPSCSVASPADRRPPPDSHCLSRRRSLRSGS